MERLEKEVGQVDDSIMLENIVRMSRENDIPVTICVEGEKFTGVIKDVTSLYGGVSYSPILYLRGTDEDDPEKERHTMIATDRILPTDKEIPADKISYITFVTEKGLLDNLIK